MCGNLTTDRTLPAAELVYITVGGVPCFANAVYKCDAGVAINCSLGHGTPPGQQPISVRAPLGRCAFESGYVVTVPPGPLALPPPPPVAPLSPPRLNLTAVSGAWSSRATWSTGMLPQEGDIVVVPPNVRVVLDCVASAGFVDLEGVLEVGDGANASLTASHVVIRSGGSFRANVTHGTFVLTLVRGAELPVVGNTVLAVMNGTLELHGRPVGASWVRLASAATAGATSIAVDADCSAWPVGAKIAVAPSSTGAGGTEVFTLVGASTDGRHLQLSAPLATSRSGPFVEVALLDRNIVVRSQDTTSAVGVGVNPFTRDII